MLGLIKADALQFEDIWLPVTILLYQDNSPNIDENQVISILQIMTGFRKIRTGLRLDWLW